MLLRLLLRRRRSALVVVVVVAAALMTSLGAVRSPRAAPQTVHALPGSTASLPCDVAPPLLRLRSLEWIREEGQRTVLVLRGAEELAKDQAAEFVGRTALSREGALTLSHLTPRDSGQYRCEVQWKDGGRRDSSVWLRVAEAAAAVELLVHGSPSHQPPVLCRFRGWGQEPVISLLDGLRTPLSAQTHKGTAQSGPHTVTATSQERETANGTVICRVEVPELVVEISSTFLHGDWAGLTVGMAAVWALVGALVGAFFGAALVLIFFPVRLVEKLRALPWRWEGPEALTVFPYGDVMLMQTSGASVETARANRVNLEGEPVTGVEVSEMLADQDFKELLKYRDDIRNVGKSLQLDPALIAALISRQSRAGKQLTPAGDGLFHSDCFGLMQINRHYHVVEGGPFSRQHLKQGATFLVQMIKTVRMREEWPDWSAEQQLKVALACYIAGQENVFREPSCERMEAITPNGDFANDVVARARHLRQKNF